jgi:hypothetical protein
MPTMTRLLTVALTLALAGCGAAPGATVVDGASLEAAAAVRVEVTALKLKARPNQPTHVTTRYTAVRGDTREKHEAAFDYEADAKRIVPDSIVMDKQSLTDLAAIAQATDELEAVMAAKTK